MNAREKILLLITNLGQGGAQRVFHDHSIFLSETYDVEEAVFDGAESENILPSGNPLFSLEVKGKGGALNKLLNFLRRCMRLRQLVQKQKSGICISHMDGANWVNALSFSPARKIFVVHGTILHDHHQKNLMQWFRQKIMIPFAYNKGDITVTVSEGIRYELERFCGVKNVISIPNYFDIENIQQLADEKLPEPWDELFSSKEVLITSGRFSEQKKQRYLFSLLKRVQNSYPEARLVLLGDGELRSELVREAEKNGLSCYCTWDEEQKFSSDYDVYFTGYTANPFQYLRRSRLFLFPSGWEGFPMALCEAMISGVPVLTADCPTGPRQILASDSFDPDYSLSKAEQTPVGWLLPMTDKPSFDTEWSDTILYMMGNRATGTEMSVQAAKLMQRYSKENVVHQWKQLINSLLQHGKRSDN